MLAGWLVLQELMSTIGNCDGMHVHLGQPSCYGALHGWRLYGQLSSLVALVLALAVLVPPLGWLRSSRLILGSVLRLLGCACPGGNTELLDV